MPVDELDKGAALPKQTVIGDKVRIRVEYVDAYQQIWHDVTPNTVFQIIGQRMINDRRVWIVSGSGPTEMFSGHVIRAWGNPNERYDGLRAAGVKLP